jgi:nicotinamide-nucleotide adenylyltransferase
LKTLSRGLFVGRFQPFHNGHLEAIRYILGKVDELIIVVGSAQYSHTDTNPFTAGERITMIRLALNEAAIEPSKYYTIPVPDVTMHSTWLAELQSYVPRFDAIYSNEPLTRLLVKEAKARIESVPMFRREIYWATEIRRRMLIGEDWSDLVPKNAAEFIEQIGGVDRIKGLLKKDVIVNGL